VVWGAFSGLLGFALLFMFQNFFGAMFRMSVVTQEISVGQMAHAAALTFWMYWLGIAGGLGTAIAGGLLGARFESRVGRRIGERVPPPATGIPQPV
jgi:hypothetical protein